MLRVVIDNWLIRQPFFRLPEEEIEEKLKTYREDMKIKAEQAALVKEFKVPLNDGRPV